MRNLGPRWDLAGKKVRLEVTIVGTNLASGTPVLSKSKPQWCANLESNPLSPKCCPNLKSQRERPQFNTRKRIPAIYAVLTRASPPHSSPPCIVRAFQSNPLSSQGSPKPKEIYPKSQRERPQFVTRKTYICKMRFSDSCRPPALFSARVPKQSSKKFPRFAQTRRAKGSVHSS